MILLVATLSGCGSSQATGTSADPAGVVPQSAPLYAEATVRPSGEQKSAAAAAEKAVTHASNPYLRVLQALQTPGSAVLTYGRDLAPWLGPHAALFLSTPGSASSLGSVLEQWLLGGSSASGTFPFAVGQSGGAQGALVLDTSDEAKARSFLESQAKRAGAQPASYRGVSYEAVAGGVSFALVHRFAVIGSESGVHGVIDTALGAAALASASSYKTLLAHSPSQAVAHLYTERTATPSSTPQAGLLGALRLLSGDRQTNISLVPSGSSLEIDADTLGAGASEEGAGLLSADPQAAQALAELPGESWLAVGLGHLGRTITKDVAALRGLASLGGASPEASGTSSLSLKSLVESLALPLGELGASTPQARRDFSSWMGSAGIFAAGSGLLELKGAAVIASNDPALSRAAVAKLGTQLQRAGASVSPATIPGTEAAIGVRLSGLPLVLDIADGRAASGQARFVLGFGEASVAAALRPSSTLASASSHAAGAASLGDGAQPSLMVDLPTLVSLLESAGLAEDPSLSKLLPYLRAGNALTGGGHDLGGGVQRYRIVLAFQPGG